MSNTLGLSCLILGIRNPSEHIFTTHISGEEPVSLLKSLIKAESPRYPDGVVIDHADDLHLWKVSIPDNDELETTLKTIQFDSDDSRLERLRPSRKLSKYFSGGVAEESIHVLVQVPAPGEWDEIVNSTALTSPPDASGSRKHPTSEVISNEAKRLKLEPSTFEFCNAFDTETSFMPPDSQ
jgi:Crinkler effector protein N-terminal domain